MEQRRFRGRLAAAVLALAMAGCSNLNCDTAGNAGGAAGACSAHVPFLRGR